MQFIEIRARLDAIEAKLGIKKPVSEAAPEVVPTEGTPAPQEEASKAE